MVSDWFKNRRQVWLCKAAEKGKTKTVRTLLKLGADINGEWEDKTPLEWAVGNKQVETSELLLDKGAKIRAKTLFTFPKMARLLLDRGADVEAEFENGMTVLMAVVVSCGHYSLPLMRLLIDRGADVNRCLNGETILMMTVRNPCGLSQEAALLIRYGADVQAIDTWGCTALMRCDIRSVALLIASGIDIDAQDFAGKTALMHAVEWGNSEVVNQLLENGANASLVNDLGDTAFFLAVISGNTRTVRQFLTYGVSVVVGETEGPQGLMLAAATGDDARIRTLLNAGCDVDVVYMDRTTLLWAVEIGHREVVQTLLEHGADVNKGDNLDRTPLSLAAQEGHAHIALLLLQQGAEINHANQGKINLLYMPVQRGWTPLILAADGGHFETVQVLLDHGAEVNARSSDKHWTALQCAVNGGFRPIVRLLLQYGADVRLLWADLFRVDYNHKLTKWAEILEELFQAGMEVDIQLASRFGSMKIVKALLDRGENVNQGNRVLSCAIGSKNIELVRFLLERGAKADIVTEKMPSHPITPLEASMQWHSEIPSWLLERGAKGSYYALSTAASKGYLDYVQMLLEAGIKADQDDPLETRVLLIAAGYGQVEVVSLLLQHGANVNRKAGENTALMAAAERGHTEVVRVLLAAGADREIQDEIGWTALKYAEEGNHTEIIQLLQQAQS